MYATKWILSAMGLVALSFSPAFAEEAGKKPEALKVLDRLVGSWDSETFSKQAEWTPQEVHAKGTLEREWVLKGRCVQEKGSHSDGIEAIVMFGYDSAKSQYHIWHFFSDGVTGDAVSQWDETTQTLSCSSDLGNGLKNVSSIHFIDNDTHEWKAKVTDSAGKVYYDGGGTCKRRK